MVLLIPVEERKLRAAICSRRSRSGIIRALLALRHVSGRVLGPTSLHSRDTWRLRVLQHVQINLTEVRHLWLVDALVEPKAQV